MKKLLLSLTLLSLSLAKAQSIDPSYIFYHQHQNLVNPAAVGLEVGHTVSVDIRNQFRDMIEAPLTQTFFTTHRLSERVGMGVSIANNKVFIQKQAALYLDLSYGIPITYNSNLIAGVKFGGDFFNIDGGEIRNYNYLYNNFYPNGSRMLLLII